MKILFLNTWGGKTGGVFTDFIKKHVPSTDIFCFQEVNYSLKNKLDKILPLFSSIFIRSKTPTNNKIGQAIFYQKNNKNLGHGKIKLFTSDKFETNKFLQYLKLSINNNILLVGNIHGKTHPGNKIDTQVRLDQSAKIIKFFKDKKIPIVFGGDFNLLPDTLSIKNLEKAGFINLINKFNIKSTRNSLAWNNLKDTPGFKRQYYADYVFVNKLIKVKSFRVPQITISDHNPQILEFDL